MADFGVMESVMNSEPSLICGIVSSSGTTVVPVVTALKLVTSVCTTEPSCGSANALDRLSAIFPLVILEAPLATVTTAKFSPKLGGVPLSAVLLEDRETTTVVTSEASAAGFAATEADEDKYTKSNLVEPLAFAECVTVTVAVFRTRRF